MHKFTKIAQQEKHLSLDEIQFVYDNPDKTLYTIEQDVAYKHIHSCEQCHRKLIDYIYSKNTPMQKSNYKENEIKENSKFVQILPKENKIISKLIIDRKINQVKINIINIVKEEIANSNVENSNELLKNIRTLYLKLVTKYIKQKYPNDENMFQELKNKFVEELDDLSLDKQNLKHVIDIIKYLKKQPQNIDDKINIIFEIINNDIEKILNALIEHPEHQTSSQLINDIESLEEEPTIQQKEEYQISPRLMSDLELSEKELKKHPPQGITQEKWEQASIVFQLIKIANSLDEQNEFETADELTKVSQRIAEYDRAQ